MDNKIKKMRKERGITQDEFGKILGVTRQTIISLRAVDMTHRLNWRTESPNTSA